MILLALLSAGAQRTSGKERTLVSEPLLLRHPTVNKTNIVFRFASGLWTVSRHGGVANRITPLKGVVGDPFLSPDGKLVAFSANYGGYNNVYVVPDSGGEPRQLTAHPSSETVVGWTPDSKFVIFSSKMLSDTDHPRLFKVSVDGGYPTALPIPTGTEASFSPDGTHLAYVPIFHRQTAWKRYRGGQASKIWIADLADSRTKEIPRKDLRVKSCTRRVTLRRKPSL
jgi:tricorn protease